MKKYILLLLTSLLLLCNISAQAAIQDGSTHTWPEYLIGSVPNNLAAITSATDKFGFIFAAPKTGSMTGVIFHTGTVTSGANFTIEIRLETIGTDGFPTGTLVSTTTNITQVITDASDDTWFDVTFTSPASLTIGERYALVMQVSSGTPTTFGLRQYGSGSGVPLTGIPWSALYNGSAWAINTSNSAMTGSIKYSGGDYPYSPAFIPGVYIASTLFNSTSTPDVRGMKVNFPAPVKVCGFAANIDLDGTAIIKLYDSDGTSVLRSYDFASANYPPITSSKTVRAQFSSPVTLSANTNYWLGLEPTSSTDLALGELTPPNTSAYTGGFHQTYGIYATAKDPSSTGSWTNSSATAIPMMGLILCGHDDGAATGATVVPTVSYQ